ncbi:MAG: DUF5050 domain-containing protein [Clostridium sp.]|nr:DUF5050 domain-containing protein [Clostridium sp.]
MKKRETKRNFAMFLTFTLLFSILGIINPSTLKAKAAEVIPEVSMASLDHSPFVEGDKNAFYVSSKGYSGKVQYQLFYTCKTTMGSNWELVKNNDLVNGWTSAVEAKDSTKIDITSLNLKGDSYRFAIRVKRVGVKGKFSNSYGDYDSSFPFAINVVKSSNLNLNGNMLIDKTTFTPSETLKINGVEGAAAGTQYKLHIYDVNNNRWIKDLTPYGDTISYDLNKLTPGAYIIDIWAKGKDSTAQYEGWKLKTIYIKEEIIPEVGIVSLDHTPYSEGDSNQFFVASKNYTGQVQYQLFYTCQTTMGSNWQLINNENMADGWTQPSNASELVKVDITNLNLKADYYRFAIRVRRVGVKGKFSNSYGDYDNALPFVINVVKDSSVNFDGKMLTEKDEYLKNDQLIIKGVEGADSNVQYKLHLYDIVNNKWIKDLTPYSKDINYDLTNIPAGTYVVDIWGKTTDSKNTYDGWKLKVININSDIKKVTAVDDTKVSIFKNSSYSLPQTVLATFEDGTKANKYVTWNGTASTEKVGIFNFEGTVLGYENKAKLTLTVEENKGNSAGNINNAGLVAYKDGFVYFCNHDDEGKIYKEKLDGTERTKVSDDVGLYLNVLGDWIYYGNYSENGELYRVKIDGTGRTKLSDDIAEFIIVENNYIYYSNTSDEGRLYRINVDGTGRTKLTNDEAAFLDVDNGVIYYANMADGQNIYKINSNGTGRTKLVTNEASWTQVVDGWIYYINGSDNYSIYKVRTNGANKTKLNNSPTLFINVSDGWIYYSNLIEDGVLERIKLDGSSKHTISSNAAFLINAVKNYIYFEDETEESKLYKVIVQ